MAHSITFVTDIELAEHPDQVDHLPQHNLLCTWTDRLAREP